MDCGSEGIGSKSYSNTSLNTSPTGGFTLQGQGIYFKLTYSTGLHSSVLLVFYTQMHQRTEPVKVGKRVTDGL